MISSAAAILADSPPSSVLRQEQMVSDGVNLTDDTDH
jgi:hypothetical protein